MTDEMWDAILGCLDTHGNQKQRAALERALASLPAEPRVGVEDVADQLWLLAAELGERAWKEKFRRLLQQLASPLDDRLAELGILIGHHVTVTLHEDGMGRLADDGWGINIPWGVNGGVAAAVAAIRGEIEKRKEV